MYILGGSTRTKNTGTIILIAINIIMYIGASIVSGSFVSLDGTYALAVLGQVNLFILKWGWWWQLITSMFIHVNLLHIGLNMFWLLILGSQYERLFGKYNLILTYLLTGLAGNLLTLLLMPPKFLSAGASGAVFGIFGGLIIVQALLGGNVGYTLLYGFFILLLNSIAPYINLYAHAGGFLAGLAIGYINVRRLRRYFFRPYYRTGIDYTY